MAIAPDEQVAPCMEASATSVWMCVDGLMQTCAVGGY